MLVGKTKANDQELLEWFYNLVFEEAGDYLPLLGPF
jgi:hypothetical protein